MEDIGFIYYWWLQDYEAAAQWFDRAGDQQEAPTWLKPLAATTLAQGGNRASSRFLWKQILSTTDVDWLKTNAEHRLAQLDAMDVIDQLNVIVDRFSARVGRAPANWEELVAGERLRGIPLDPSGEPFVLEPPTGHVTVSSQSQALAASYQYFRAAHAAAMSDSTSLLVLSGVFGLAIGSFLNVCIYRIPLGQSLVSPPSRCPKCGRPLTWVGQHSGPQLGHLAAGSVVAAGRRSRRSIRSSSWSRPSPLSRSSG